MPGECSYERAGDTWIQTSDCSAKPERPVCPVPFSNAVDKAGVTLSPKNKAQDDAFLANIRQALGAGSFDVQDGDELILDCSVNDSSSAAKAATSDKTVTFRYIRKQRVGTFKLTPVPGQPPRVEKATT